PVLDVAAIASTPAHVNLPTALLAPPVPAEKLWSHRSLSMNPFSRTEHFPCRAKRQCCRFAGTPSGTRLGIGAANAAMAIASVTRNEGRHVSQRIFMGRGVLFRG